MKSLASEYLITWKTIWNFQVIIAGKEDYTLNTYVELCRISLKWFLELTF